MKCKILILITFLLNSLSSFSQSNDFLIKNESLLSVIDQFVLEVTLKYDSFSIKNKNLGVIVVELYHVDKQLFPMGVFPPDSLAKLDRAIKYEFRISMVFWKGFFTGNTPSFFSNRMGRYIVFYTGIEYLISDQTKSKRVLKKMSRSLNDSDYIIVSWLVKIDELSKDKIIITERSTY